MCGTIMDKIIKATTNPIISKREIKHIELARNIACEGMVLLKNDDVLPVKEKRIALYGSGARRTVAGGTGSGATHARDYISIESGLMRAGFEIATTDWLNAYDDFYDNSYAEWKAKIEERVKGMYALNQILGEVFKDKFVYPTGIPVKESDVADCETAIYVIARQAGEGTDRFDRKGDWQLDDLEIANLKFVSEHYKKLLVVINVGGYVDLSFTDYIRTDAIIYFSQAGMAGGDAFADIVSGKVSPSGKLSSTWAKNLDDFPSTTNFSYKGDTKNQKYTEGIYVGYRYFDTFGVAPRYAFGHGLSYTKFELQSKVSANGKKITVAVDVKNIGSYNGKEVVQVYVSVPEADCGVENKRLVAFVKTPTINAGASYKAELNFSMRDLTHYCEKHSAYVLKDGNYVVRVGDSSDNTSPVAVLELDKKVICEKCVSVCASNKKICELVAPKRKEEVLIGLPVVKVDASSIKTVEHEYKTAEVEDEALYKFVNTLSEKELATLVIGGSVSGERIVNAMGASGTTTSLLYEKYGIPNIILSDGPAGINVTPVVVEMPDGSLGTTEVYPQYDYGFFGQMMRKRIVTDFTDKTVHYQYATAFPVSMVRAQTWNTELLEEMGKAIGKEMEEFGITVWLAPGLNIQRNTLCGRTFEYYSEDPVLSGNIAAAVVNGVQSIEGKSVTIKHFACNNSEFDRHYSSSNLDERTLREIYLKGFEIAVKNSKPKTVMASYNKINGVYSTNNYDLLVNVLRNEWSFDGMVMSDWEAIQSDRGHIALAHKAQCDLVMPGTDKQIKELEKSIKNGIVNINDVKRSAVRILRLITENTVIKCKTIKK